MESFAWENFYKIDRNTIKKSNINFVDLSKLVHDMNSPINLLSLMFNRLESKIDSNDLEIIKRQLLKLSNLTNQIFSPDLMNIENCETKSSLNLAIDNILEDKILLYPDILIKVIRKYDVRQNVFLNIKYFDFLGLLSNIFNNSIEARTKDTVILKIDYTFIEENYLLLTISDNGRGISKDNLKKLGHFGVSFGKENAKHSGHGIGLYSVKETLKKYNGDLKIHSRLGIGTNVLLKLPVIC